MRIPSGSRRIAVTVNANPHHDEKGRFSTSSTSDVAAYRMKKGMGGLAMEEPSDIGTDISSKPGEESGQHDESTQTPEGARTVLHSFKLQKGDPGLDSTMMLECQKHYHAAIDKLPDGMAVAAAKNLKSVKVYSNPQEVEQATFHTINDKGGMVLGVTDITTGDMRFSWIHKSDIDGSDPIWGRNPTTTVIHEMGHVVDKIPEGYDRSNIAKNLHSMSKEFLSASEPEILNGHLSDYAKASPQEAWAEYGRLVAMDRDKAQREFPKCWKVWSDAKLT